MFLGSGSFDHGSTKLRFLVLERFGKDVDELFISNGRRFDITTVLILGLRVVSTTFCCYNRESNEMPLILFVALIYCGFFVMFCIISIKRQLLSGLALSFESPVALFSTLVANLLLCG